MTAPVAPGALCPYCAQPLGSSPIHDEHPLSAVLGGALTIPAHVDCGATLNREVDEPLAKSLPVRQLRSAFGIRDRRGRARHAPRVVGHDAAGQKHLLEFLPLGRVRPTPVQGPATVRPAGRRAFRLEPIKLGLGWWPRTAAKIALGFGAMAARPEWLVGETANDLRGVLWSRTGHTPRLALLPAPVDPPDGLPLDAVAEPEHFVWTVRHAQGGASLGMWLFGTWFLTAPLAWEPDEVELISERAWLMNPYERRSVRTGTLVDVSRFLRRRHPQVAAFRDIQADELLAAEQRIAELKRRQRVGA